MKRLSCEMCGSTDLIKQDGVFVCQACGCKYSIEEARKMMVEGVVEVTGTVKVDNSAKISNMLINANRAFSDAKYSEAERLFGQILNEDPENATAILYQGLSLGWQGNTVRYYMDKTGTATERALEIAYKQLGDGKEFESFAKDALTKINDIGFALADLCSKNISELYDKTTAEVNRMTKVNLEHSYPVYKPSDFEAIKPRINSQVEKYQKINDNTLLIVLSAYERAIGMLSNVDAYSVPFYYSLIQKLSKYKDKAFYQITTNKADSLKQTIDKYLKKIADKAEREKKKATAAYWAEHREKKSELEIQKRDLMNEKTELQKQKTDYEIQIKSLDKSSNEDVSAKKEIKEIEKTILQLRTDKAKLGIFKGKEKRAIDSQIEELNHKIKELEPIVVQQENEKKSKHEQQLSSIRAAISPLSERISKIDSKIAGIDHELTRERSDNERSDNNSAEKTVDHQVMTQGEKARMEFLMKSISTLENTIPKDEDMLQKDIEMLKKIKDRKLYEVKSKTIEMSKKSLEQSRTTLKKFKDSLKEMQDKYSV